MSSKSTRINAQSLQLVTWFINNPMKNKITIAEDGTFQHGHKMSGLVGSDECKKKLL
jgi:hypothetical protein